MNKGIMTIAVFSACMLISSPLSASPPDDVLDEITIRVIENGSQSINFNDIALPNIAGEQGGDHPAPNDNANEHAAQGAENASHGAEKAAEKAAKRAARAAEKAAEAAENAAVSAENAAENAAEAAENAAEARDNAAEAAKNKRNSPGRNKK